MTIEIKTYVQRSNVKGQRSKVKGQRSQLQMFKVQTHGGRLPGEDVASRDVLGGVDEVAVLGPASVPNGLVQLPVVHLAVHAPGPEICPIDYIQVGFLT